MLTTSSLHNTSPIPFPSPHQHHNPQQCLLMANDDTPILPELCRRRSLISKPPKIVSLAFQSIQKRDGLAFHMTVDVEEPVRSVSLLQD